MYTVIRRLEESRKLGLVFFSEFTKQYWLVCDQPLLPFIVSLSFTQSYFIPFFTEMPYPGLIREVWKELPGKSITKLKDDPYYPNDPSLIEIIENFDSPFDIDKDYGSRVKGYFVAPETGNYTFYMSGSHSGELWMSSTESQQNMTKLVSLDQPTGHNQWNKYVLSHYFLKEQARKKKTF